MNHPFISIHAVKDYRNDVALGPYIVMIMMMIILILILIIIMNIH